MRRALAAAAASGLPNIFFLHINCLLHQFHLCVRQLLEDIDAALLSMSLGCRQRQKSLETPSAPGVTIKSFKKNEKICAKFWVKVLHMVWRQAIHNWNFGLYIIVLAGLVCFIIMCVSAERLRG